MLDETSQTAINQTRTSKMWKPDRKVNFEEKVAEPTQAEFYTHLEKHVRQSLWIYLVFFLSSWVEFTIYMNRVKEGFVTSREISCLTEDIITRNNWTYFQLRNISYGNMRYNCERVDKLDELLAYSFERALKESASKRRLKYVTCSSILDPKNYNRTYEFLGTCKSYIYRQRLEMCRILGEIIGPLPLGCLADLYGRKLSVLICLVLWTANIILTGLFQNYHVSQLFAIFDGAATVNMHVWSLLLFLEICDKSERGLMCLYLDIFQMGGWLTGVYLKASCGDNSKGLIFILGFPLVMLYFYIWYIPESPRWCISYGKKKKAWIILKRLGVKIDDVLFLPPVKFSKWKTFLDNTQYLTSYVKYKKALGLGSFLYFIAAAVYETEAKFVTLKYLTISSHVDMLFLGHLASHIFTVPIFLLLGRHLTIFFFITISILNIIISIFAEDEFDYTLNIMNILCTAKLQRLVLVYISEIIPTSCRGLCIGLFMFISNVFYLIHFIYQEIMLGSVIDNEHAVLITYQALGLAVLFTLPYKGAEELPDYKVYRK